MAAVDSWSDGWESIADREAAKAKSEAVEVVGENGSSSGSSTTSNSSSLTAQATSPKILSKKVAAEEEEENRKIWEAANASNAFEVVPSASAPTKVVNFKPELKILKRAPPAAPVPKSVNTNDSPAILDRKEKERRYAEARERLFGPASSTASSDSTASVTTTPTAGMSRSSSSSGLPIKNGENGSGTTAPTRERGGGVRGGKKGGRGNNSGNNTPRSRSPGRGQRGSDPNRTSGIVGGITKVTENGWVYTGTGQTPRTSSPASTRSMGVDSHISPPGIAAVSAGMMSMNLNTTGGYNPAVNSFACAPGMSNPWGMGSMGAGPGSGVIGQRPQGGYIPPSQGYPPQQYFPQNQSYPMTQPPPPFPKYLGPPASFGTHTQPYQQQQPQTNKLPYQNSGVTGPYNMPPPQQHPTMQQQQHQHPAMPQQQHSIPPSHHNYQRPFPQISNAPSPVSTPIPPAPRCEPIGGNLRTVYIQDPHAYAPRPPPPQGNLLPGYGNNPATGVGTSDSLNPIRAPRGPDMSMGRGFSGRGGRGGGFDAC